MAEFEIPEHPEYNRSIRKFETTDPAHADLFNAVVQTLINNDEFFKRVVEKQKEDALYPRLRQRFPFAGRIA